VGSKRRRDSDDDELEGVDEAGLLVGSVAKRSRLVTEVASAPEEHGPLPPPSPSPSPRENTPEASATTEAVEAPPVTDPTTEEVSADAPVEAAESTDTKDSSDKAVVVEEHAEHEDDGRAEDESSLAEATSSQAQDDIPSSSSEETPSSVHVCDDKEAPITQIPVLAESATASNVEAPEVPETIEVKGIIPTEMPTSSLDLLTPAPIEVN